MVMVRHEQRPRAETAAKSGGHLGTAAAETEATAAVVAAVVAVIAEAGETVASPHSVAATTDDHAATLPRARVRAPR